MFMNVVRTFGAVLFLALLCSTMQAVEPQIAHGESHTLYLASDGVLWAVGRNVFGQLGDGTEITRTVPVQVDLSAVDGQVVEISAGANHSVLRTSTSRVYCWGLNNQGQCGKPVTTAELHVPTDTGINYWARSIDAGYAHTMVALHDGNMYMFGDNQYGQIGNGNNPTDATSYTWVTIPGEEVLDVSAGRYHSMALCASGKVYTWGFNGYYQLGHGDTTQRNTPVYMAALGQVKQISAGRYHSMALTENGYAYAWGLNTVAQCNPSFGGNQATPFLARSGVKAIVAGYNSSYALYLNGQVYAWGQNTTGECGDGTTTSPVAAPAAVSGVSYIAHLPQDVNSKSMSAIRADGAIQSWGRNVYEMLNIGTSVHPVLSAETAVARWRMDELTNIEGGFSHVRAKKADGTIWSWGRNGNGEMGTGAIGGNTLTPVQSQNGSLITDVDTLGVGLGYHSLVGRVYGAMYSWGKNNRGQVDNGLNGTDEPVPLYRSSRYAIHISNGYEHSALVNYAGTVYTTGANSYGQLGDGAIGVDKSNFTSIPIYNAKIASAGVFHSAALRADGTVWCWGQGSNYELGNGGVSNSDVPVQVLKGVGNPLNNIIDVVAGYRFTLALDANGKMWSWGSNANGQTGQGTATGNTQYATLIGFNYYTKISAGLYHVAAIDRFGDVWTWGKASNGRLANGLSAGDVLTPVNVSNASMVDGLAYDLSCTAEATVVLLANGDVYSAGVGTTGVMGNGTNASVNPNWTALEKNYYPEITITASSDAFESGSDASFTVTRSLSLAGILETTGIAEVSIDPNQGVAVEGTDINIIAQPIIIPAGASSTVFTVDAVDDNIDEDNESIQIDLVTKPFYSIGSPSSATRNVIDNDTAAVIVTAPESPFTDEYGGWVAFTIKLATEPTENVTINFSSSDTSEGVVSASSIVITPGSWTSTKYVYMDGQDDAVDDGDIAYSFNVTSVTSFDDKYNNITPNAFNGNLTNTDNDTAGYTFSAVGDTSEAGGATIFSLVLKSQPTADVVITFDSSNTDEGTVSPSSLTFTAANWSSTTGHKITITGVDDDFDDGDIVYQVNANPDGTTADVNYKNMVVGNAALINIDDDTAGISVSAMSGATSENGTTAWFSIQLDSQPFNDVQIPLNSLDTSEGIPQIPSITITPAQWNVPHIVVVDPVDDDIVDGPVVYEIQTASAASSDPKYNGYDAADIAVTNDDDDTKGVVFTPVGPLTLTEGDGSVDVYTVRLASEPQGGGVTIQILPDTQLDVNTTELSFSATDWNVDQTVTVEAVDDSISEESDGVPTHSGVITHIMDAVGTDYELITIDDMTADITDDDSYKLVVIESAGSSSVSEAGTTTDTFTVALSSVPSGDVVVTVRHDDTEVTVNGGVTVDLTFTTSDWNTPQTVTIQAIDDPDLEPGTGIALIYLNAVGNDYTGRIAADSIVVNATVIDDDLQGIVVTPASGLMVTEAEGTASFDIVLSKLPTSNVNVTVVSDDLTEGTVPATVLIFTPADWSTPQPVTITGVNDFVDDDDQAFNIEATATSTDSAYEGETATVAVTNIDDDTASLTLSPNDGITTTEHGSIAIFNVSMGSEPTGDVVLGFTSSDAGEGDIVGSSQLTFTVTNWFIPQTITIQGVDDLAADEAQPYSIQMTVIDGSTADILYKALPDDSVQVFNFDNDDPGVTITETSGSTAVFEGGASDTFDVVLDTEPTTPVTITISPEPELSTDKATLIFNSGNWNAAQTVTVTASADVVMEEDVPHSANIFINSSGGEYTGLSFQFVSVDITDDDTAGVTVTPTSGLVVAEDSSSAAFTIKLNTEPTSNVTIEFDSSDDSEGYPDPNSITFTPSDWSTAQTITVYGEDDEVDDGDIAFMITASANSADVHYDSISVSSVNVTNTDMDTVGIIVSTAAFTVDESGTSDGFTVVLASEPTSPVTIAVSSSDTTEVTANVSSLSFTSATWDIPQVVSVTGIDDEVVDGDTVNTIVLATAISSDTNYSGINPSDVVVTNDDDDVAGVIITQTSGFTQVTEGGANDTYDIVLDSEPTVSITINLTVGSQLITDVASIVFTSANWSTPQTVTVSAFDDDIDEDAEVDSISMTSSDAEYSGVSIDSVSVNIDDDDTSGITVAPIAGLVTTETAGESTFTIVLDSQPTADVTFAISSTNTAEGTVNPASITLTSVNWSTEQVVTITGVDDAASDDGDQNYTIVIAADNSTADTDYNGLDPDDVSVTNIDDDGAAVIISSSSVAVSEDGVSDTYDVVLASSPSTEVTITLSVDSAQVTLNTYSLTFDSGNWDIAQTVTVGAVNDAVAEGTHNVIISQTSAGGEYDGIPVNDVTVLITDNDAAGVSVTPVSGLQTSESGSTDSFTVVLNSQPTSNVTINLSSSDTSEGTVSPGSLTFTASNWETVQTVTVTGSDDNSADGNVTYTVILSAVSSDDSFYDGGTPIDPTDVTVSNTDDEVAGITVTPTSGLNTTEGGGSSVFTVRLNTQPSSDVVIALASDTSAEGAASLSSLTFTNSNWNTPQTVTVTGVDDDTEDGDQVYSIVLDAAVSADASYGAPAIDPADVSVTNLDDDTAGFTITPSSGLVTSETGATAVFTVVLDSQPTANVTFDVSSSDLTEGTVDKAILNFTSVTWNTGQVVTITGVDDGASDGDTAYNITNDNVSSGDANYAALDPTDVSVTNQDNDSPAVNVTESDGSTDVSESGLSSDTYTVVLATIPSSQVDVAVNVASGEVSASPSTLTFTVVNYNIPQTVTVTAIQDTIAEGAHTDLIAHVASSTDGNYNGITITNVTANVADNDTAAIVVNPSSGLVTTESGGTAEFIVVLATQPTASVTIPVVSDNSAEGVISISSIIFTTGDWNVPQTITVTGVDDSSDDGPVAYNITLSAPSSGDAQYAAINPDDVALSNSDDDGVDVIFSESLSSSDISEDGLADSYTAVLNSAPTDDVIITPVPDANLTVSPASLTFTSANWNTVQSFAITAVDDNVAEGTHLGSIGHTATSVGDASYNGLALAGIAVTITDNDSALVIVTPVSGLITNETGTTDTFTVRLNSQPTADVDFTLSSSDIGEGTVSPTSLQFTSVNWASEQTVTVTGVDDAATIDGAVGYSIQTSVTTSADLLYNGLTVDDVSVTNLDNDQAAILISVIDNSTNEADIANTAVYSITLATQPTSDVQLAVVVDSNGTLQSAASLTFTASGGSSPWNVAQQITLNAFDDNFDEDNHSAMIQLTLSGDGVYAALPAYDIEMNIADDDTAGVTLSAITGLFTNELGLTDSYTIVLDSEPIGGAAVSISVTSSDTGQVTVPGAPIIFDAGNAWNIPQTITLTGVDVNNTDDGDVSITISHADAVSADGKYSGMSISDVSATNNAVNNEPTFNGIVNQNIQEDIPEQLIVLTGVSDGQTGENQTLTLSALSNNTAVIPHPTITDNGDGTADLKYTPVGDQFGTATITVTVSDDGGTAGANDDDTLTRTFDVIVNAQNDIPVITVLSSLFNGELVAMVATTGTGNTITNVMMSATDIEDADATLEYTLVLKPSQGDIQLNGAVVVQGGTWTQDDIDTGKLAYFHNELAGSNTDGFAFKVRDFNAGERAGVFQIYVDRTAPALSLSSTNLDYPENTGALEIDSAAIVTSGTIDPMSNGSLLIEWTAGQTTNDNIVFAGAVTVDVARVVRVGVTIVGNLDSIKNGQDGADMLVNFASNPLTADIQSLVRGIAYRNDSDNPATALRTIQMTLNDGFVTGGTVPRSINMQASNDDPVIGAGTTFGTVLEVDLTSTLPVSDVDGTIVTIVVTSAPSLGTVSITNQTTGAFIYQPTPATSGTDTFDILVTDNDGASTAATITVAITDVNSLHPRIISDPPMFVLDGDTLVYTPMLDPQYAVIGTITYELLDKPSALPDPISSVSGTISWDLTGYAGQVLRFSYIVKDIGASTIVGIQPVMIHVYALPIPVSGG